MNQLRWLMRAKRWAQNPPSTSRVMLVLGIVAICLLLFGYEQLFGWPDALTTERFRPPAVRSD